MDIDAKIKKIKTQIKYGRAVEAGRALESLWSEVKNTEDEKTVLQVFAFDLLMKTKIYERAIPVLQRLLELDIDEQVRVQATEFLIAAIDKSNLLPSTPDVSNSAFVEFMDAIRSKEIFRSAPKLLALDECFVVADIEMAKSLAWRQEIEAPFQSWNQLRTSASKQIRKHIYENKIDIDRIDDQITREINKVCEQNLSPLMMNFYDDISGDLAEIALGRLIGIIPDLHVRMWYAYMNKAFPCGWRGDCPEGQLCIFPNV